MAQCPDKNAKIDVNTAYHEHITTNVYGQRNQIACPHCILDVASRTHYPVHSYVRRRARRQKRLPLPNLLAMPEDRLFIYQTTTKIGRANRRAVCISREPRISADHLTANQV